MSVVSFGIPIVLLTAVAVMILVVVLCVVSGSSRRRSNVLPVSVCNAVAVSKRADAQQPQNGTKYFVTFELETGTLTELNISEKSFAVINEGDKGRLTYQGGSFLEFERF